MRCRMLVTRELDAMRFTIVSVELGKAEIKEEPSAVQFEQLRQKLREWGLELLDDRKSILIEKIKSLLINSIYDAEEQPKINYSTYLTEKLNYDYTYLSNLFSKQTGLTIRQFIIMHKIERVKQMLLDTEMTLTEIGYRMQYSSVAHLSNQFKKITGMTPMYFRNSQDSRRLNLEDL